jgi:GGDEF domain-containing protein
MASILVVMQGSSRISERVGERVPEIITAWQESRADGIDEQAYERLCGCMERVIGIFTEFLRSDEGVETFSRGGSVRALIRETAQRQHDLGHDAVGVIEDFAALRRAVWRVVERNADLSSFDGGEVARFFSKMLDASDWVTEAALEAFDDLVREDMEEAIGRAAATDLLTGLPDRDLFERLLLPRAIEEHGQLSLAIFDVARFSEGVAAGDFESARRTLLDLTETVRKAAPEEAVLARFGDDEICLLLPGAGGEEAYANAERVLEGIGTEDPDLHVGVAEYPAHGSDAEGVIQQCVKALRMAKRLGGSGIVIAHPRTDAPDGGGT